MTKHKPTTVIFDAVGTLIFVGSGVGGIYQAAGRQYGSKLDIDEIASRFQLARTREFSSSNTIDSQVTSDQDQRQKWYRIVAGVFDDVARPGPLFEQIWNTFSEPAVWRVYPEAETVIDRLNQAGLTIAIGSNFDSRLQRIIAGLPALKRVQRVFTSGEIGHAKPSVHFFRAIERSLSVTPAECVMVGDEQACDQHGAANAGWASWLVDRKRTDSDINHGIVCDLSPLPDLLGS